MGRPSHRYAAPSLSGRIILSSPERGGVGKADGGVVPDY